MGYGLRAVKKGSTSSTLNYLRSGSETIAMDSGEAGEALGESLGLLRKP